MLDKKDKLTANIVVKYQKHLRRRYLTKEGGYLEVGGITLVDIEITLANIEWCMYTLTN